MSTLGTWGVCFGIMAIPLAAYALGYWMGKNGVRLRVERGAAPEKEYTVPEV